MVDWGKTLIMVRAHIKGAGLVAKLFSGRDALRYPLTLSLFVAAFLLPLGILGFFGKGPLNLRVPIDQAVTERTHPRLAIRGPNSYVKVTTADPNGHLGPIEGQELLILMWLKLNAIQADNRRAVALLQLQSEQKSPPGFGLAFMKTPDRIRPEVYWRSGQSEKTVQTGTTDHAGKIDQSGRTEGWLSFEDLEADLAEPVILALSVRGGKILGLHQIQRGEGTKNSVRLLGGAEIGQYGALQGSNSLLIGAPDHSNFKGDVFGLIIQSASRIPEDLNSHLKTMGFWPQDVAKSIPKEELQLFVDGSGQVAGVPVQPLVYHRAAVKDPSNKRASK